MVPQCSLCRKTVYRDDALFFEVRRQHLAGVMLNGLDPWCGVRTVCRDCAVEIARQAESVFSGLAAPQRDPGGCDDGE